MAGVFKDTIKMPMPVLDSLDWSQTFSDYGFVKWLGPCHPRGTPQLGFQLLASVPSQIWLLQVFGWQGIFLCPSDNNNNNNFPIFHRKKSNLKYIVRDIF